MIRVLIVGPAAVERAGLEALLASSPEMKVVGSLPDFTGTEDVQADVVLAAMEPAEIPSWLGSRVLPLVLVTGEAEPVYSLEALRVGVRAVLPRAASPAEVLASVEAAASGLAVIDPQDLEQMLLSAMPVQASESESVLTSRELEVLRLMADGAANKVIAWKLGISESTVKFHVASILSKLGAGTRTEAVAIGIRRGLVLL